MSFKQFSHAVSTLAAGNFSQSTQIKNLWGIVYILFGANYRFKMEYMTEITVLFSESEQSVHRTNMSHFFRLLDRSQPDFFFQRWPKFFIDFCLYSAYMVQ